MEEGWGRTRVGEREEGMEIEGKEKKREKGEESECVFP